MDAKRLIEIQGERGAKNNNSDIIPKSINTVISECRRYIQDNTDDFRNLDPEGKRNTIKKLIVDFVMQCRYVVEGYMDDENRTDTNKLVDRLVEDITDHGILTLAMDDPTVYEIRCNGKELKIEQGGKIKDYTDKDGKIISFETPEQQDIVIRRLLGDVRFTPKDAVINARTVEGYRIAAVHCTALSPDPIDPTNDKYHAFVLRKFKKSKMKLGDIVLNRTMSDNMARTCVLLTIGGLPFVTVGPTASGKTTTNNAILQSVPSGTRVILLQNPSEIDLRFRDASGRIYNDVLHLEARDITNPSPTDPTVVNLMNQILRLSPTLVCFGELRKNSEFGLGMEILQAGHPVNATYHAEDSMGAFDRFLTAYMANSGEGIETALSTLARLLSIIIVQKIMRDGTRKVLQITEVLGVDPNNERKPLLNDLYVFKPTGEPKYDSSGNVIDIPGMHKRVGKISEKNIAKLKLEGVKPSRYDFLLKDVDENEVEEYTGENIDTYGV